MKPLLFVFVALLTNKTCLARRGNNGNNGNNWNNGNNGNGGGDVSDYISAKPLPQSSFTLDGGQYNADFDSSRTIRDFFEFPSWVDNEDYYSLSCRLNKITGFGSCSSRTSSGISAAFQDGDSGIFEIDARTPFSIENVCIYCWYIGYTDYSAGTDGFTITTTNYQPECSSESNLRSISGVTGVTLAPGDYTSAQGATPGQLPEFVALENDVARSDCGIASYTIIEGSYDSADADAKITPTPVDNKLTISTVSDQAPTSDTTFYFRLKITFDDGSSLILYDAMRTYFKWSFADVCGSATLTAGAIPNGKQQLQYVSTGAPTAFFALPEYTSSDSSNCPVTSQRVSTNSGDFLDHPSLGEPQANAYSGTPLAVAPNNPSLEEFYYFRLYVQAGPSVEEFSTIFTLVVGCPSEKIHISYSFPAGSGASQWVSLGEASTRFRLPDFTSESPSTCSPQAMEARTVSDTSQRKNELNDPSGNYISPVDPSLEQKISFVIQARVSSITTFTETFSLVVGCPQGAVTITEQAFPTGYFSEQFVVLDGASPQIFVAPRFTSDKSVEGCPMNLIRVSKSGSAFETYPELQNPAWVTDHYEVSPTTATTIPATFTFFIQAGNSFRSTGAHTFSSAYKLVVGCDQTHAKFSEFEIPFLMSPVTVPQSDPSTKYLFSSVVSKMPSCPVISYIVSEAKDSGIKHPELTDPAESSNLVQVLPQDPSLNNLYTFYIGYRGLGMNYFIYIDQQINFQVGTPASCDSSAVIQISTTYPSGLNAIQYTPNPPNSKFLLPSITSDDPNCLVTLRVSSTKDVESPMTATLSAPERDATGYSVTLLNSDEVIEFYIVAEIDNGQKEFSSEKYRLYVGCHSSYDSFSIVETRPADFTSEQLTTTGASAVFKLPSYATNAPHCGIESYKLSTQPDIYEEMTQLEVPALDADGCLVIVPKSPSIDGLYHFYLFVYSINEAVSWTSEKLTFVVGCPADYPLSATATDSYPYASRTATQSFMLGTGSARFYIPQITTSVSYCQLDFSSFDYVPEKESTTPLGGLNSVAQNADGYYYIAPSDPDADDYFEFYIRAAFQNGQKGVVDKLFKFYVGCPAEITHADYEEPDSYDHPLEQRVNLNDIGGPTEFKLNTFKSTVSGCPPVEFRVSSKPDELLEDLELDVSTSDSGQVLITPRDTSTAAEFTFYIQLKAANGFTKIMPLARNFKVGCLPEWVTTVQQQTSIFEHEIFIGKTNLVQDVYPKPVLSSTVNACTVTRLTLFDPSGNVELDLSPECTSNVFCSTILSEANGARASFSFTFKVEVGHGSYFLESPAMLLKVECDADSSLILLPTYNRLLLDYGDTSPRQLEAPSCSVESCCYGMTYRGQSLPSTNVQSIQESATDRAMLDVVFDTSAIATYNVVIQVANTPGTTATSNVFIVEIKFNCEKDDGFQISKAKPQSEEIKALRGLGQYQVSSDGSFKIVLAFKVGQVPSLDIDISERLINSALPGSCPISNFKISKVAQASGVEVKEAVWKDLLAISADGVFSVLKTIQAVDKYLVFISAYNGAVWSDATVTGHLIELEITEEVVALPNVPPKFISPPEPVSLSFGSASESTSSSSQLEVALPEVYDANSDTFKIELLTKAAFLSLSSSQKALVVDHSKVEESQNLTVSIQLTDAKGGVQVYEMKLSLDVKKEIEEEVEDKESPLLPDAPPPVTLPSKENQPAVDLPTLGEPDKSVETKTVAAKIASIDKFGLLKISFNATMAFGVKPEFFNSTTVEIWIVLPPGAEDGSQPPPFTWHVTSFTERELELQLSFVQPLDVSVFAEQDTLHLRFSKTAQSYLFSPTQRRYLHDRSIHLKKKVPKQMPDSAATRTLESASGGAEMGMTYLLVVTFLLNYVMAGGMRYMLLLIRSLQIMLHIPLIRIIVPSNVSQLFRSLIPIATFDVLDPDWTTKLVFTFDEQGQTELQDDLLDQMVDLGYETHNSILNLGSLAIFTLFYFLQLGAVLLLQLFRRSPKQFKFIDDLKRRLLFGDLIAILLDAYFEFLISGYLQIKKPLDTTGGEVSSIIMGIFSYMLVLGFMNYAFAQLLLSPLEVVQEDPGFNEKWGQLHEGVKTKSKLTLGYFPIFAARRVVFLALAFQLGSLPQLQLIGLIWVNFIVIFYICHVRPLDSRKMNRIEITNEIAISISTYALLTFTAWVPEERTKFNYGWVMIVTIGLSIIFNLYFVITSGSKYLGLLYTKHKRNREAKAIIMAELKFVEAGSPEELSPASIQSPSSSSSLTSEENSESSISAQGMASQNPEPSLATSVRKASMNLAPLQPPSTLLPIDSQRTHLDNSPDLFRINTPLIKESPNLTFRQSRQTVDVPLDILDLLLRQESLRKLQMDIVEGQPVERASELTLNTFCKPVFDGLDLSSPPIRAKTKVKKSSTKKQEKSSPKRKKTKRKSSSSSPSSKEHLKEPQKVLEKEHQKSSKPKKRSKNSKRKGSPSKQEGSLSPRKKSEKSRKSPRRKK